MLNRRISQTRRKFCTRSSRAFVPSHRGLQRRGKQAEAWTLEEWLDESIGIATGFVYYEFRAGAGKQIYPSVLSQLMMQLARRQFSINPFAEAKHGPVAPECCFKPVAPLLARWCLFGRRFLERGRYCCCHPAESLSFLQPNFTLD
jgi:hypothetical protein